MKESSIYTQLWQKYRPVIISKMKLAVDGPQEYQLSKHEFEVISERKSSGHAFNLEINKGMLVNKISGTAVVRDLFEVLKSSNTATEMMQGNYFKINLTKDYRIKIQIIPAA